MIKKIRYEGVHNFDTINTVTNEATHESDKTNTVINDGIQDFDNTEWHGMLSYTCIKPYNTDTEAAILRWKLSTLTWLGELQ